jgi:hypothetical protein
MRRSSIEVARDMAYKRTAMLDFARECPTVIPADEFDRLNRQIHRYAALVEDAQEYAEQCQFLLEELRAGRGGNQLKPLYTHDLLGDISAGNADCRHLGHERRRHTVQQQPERFLGGRWSNIGSLRLGRVRPVPVQVLLR